MQFSRFLSILIGPCITLGPRGRVAFATCFTFDQEQCEKGSFHNDEHDESSDLFFVRNASSTSCSPTVGLSTWMSEPKISSLTSSGPAASLWKGPNENVDGISFEMWIMPSATEPTGDRHPIFTIGTQNVNESLPMFAFSPCFQQAFDFQIASYQNQLEVFFRTNDVDFEPCQNYRVTFQKLIPWRLYHVVVSLKDYHQQVFINGVPSPILSQPFANDLSHWSSQYAVHVFSHPLSSATWSGTVFRVGVHRGILETSQVYDLLRVGLPSAEPYAFSHVISVNEDAEESPGSHPPEWYARPSPVHEAQRIEIRPLSIAYEIHSILKELQINSTLPIPPGMYVYLTALPSVGTLYKLDGKELSTSTVDSKVLIPISIDNPRFIYIPPMNLFSTNVEDPISKMTYCVTSAPIFDPIQCDSKEIMLHVIPVNDPPLTCARDPIVVYEGNASAHLIPISFPAIDVDVGDSLQDIQIVRPPLYGELRLFVTSYRPHGLLDGTPLSLLGFRLAGDPQGQVTYSVIPEKLNEMPVQGEAIRDSFTYRVSDSTGTWSATALVEIIIVSAVQAIIDTDFQTKEDSKEHRNVNLRVLDTSGLNRPLRIFIESVPSSEQGIMLDPADPGKILAGGMILNHMVEPPYEGTIALTFIPAPNYCSVDGVNMHSVSPVLAFRATALDGAGKVVSVSDTATQMLDVLCYADGIQLTVVNTTLETPTLGLMSLESTQKVGDYIPIPPFAETSGVAITTVDKKLTEALVIVSTKNGLLSFNQDFWGYTVPILGRPDLFRYEIQFLAYVEDINHIFEHLRFQSFLASSDTIDLRLHHGRCGSYGATELQSSGCQTLSGSIPVLVHENNSLHIRRTKLIDGFPWQLLICMVLYPLVYYCYVEADQSRCNRTCNADNEQDTECGAKKNETA